jgi:hypothetical protein
MSTAAIFLDNKKAFDNTWQNGLLCKLSKLKFSTNLIKHISSFLTKPKFRVSVEGEMPAPGHMKARAPQGSILSLALYNLCINNTLQTNGVHLALFTDDTCLYETERKKWYVLRELQRGLNSIATWCEFFNIKINEGSTRAIYFTHRI